MRNRQKVGRNNIEVKDYGTFYKEMNMLGTWLFTNNVRNKHVAIIGENSYEWLLVFFAVVNGGNVAVPIDKELPKSEIEKLVGKADVNMVFCSDAYIDLTEDLDVEVYRIFQKAGIF